MNGFRNLAHLGKNLFTEEVKRTQHNGKTFFTSVELFFSKFCSFSLAQCHWASISACTA